ncbi:cache domain-containing protein [bacterium]|nr:cache domain-containing protein [bacterium]
MEKRFLSAQRANIIRTAVPAGLTVLLMLILVFVIVLPAIESNMIKVKREMIMELTNTVYSMLSEYEARHQAGELSLEDAQHRAITRIRNMRYGPEGKDYFWINDKVPVIIMHPYRTDLEGQDVTNYVDPQGKHLFVEFVRVVEESGHGFVDYVWQWKDDPTRLVPKLSYVREFEPWGWIVGTGIYLEDVHAEIATLTRQLHIAFAVIIAIVIALSIYIVCQGGKSEHKRLQAEMALSQSEEKFRTVANFTYDWEYWMGDNKEFIYITPSCERITGYNVEQFMNSNRLFIDIVHPDDQPIVLKHFYEEIDRRTTSEPLVFRIITKSGEEKWIEHVCQPVITADQRFLGWRAANRDITEMKHAEFQRRQAEIQMRQAQKMEALGTLAGGIAHDFNNLLFAIRANIELALDESTPGSSLYGYLTETDKATHRASALVNHILSFARQAEVQQVRLHIAPIINEVVAFMRSAIPASTSITVTNHLEKACTIGDAAQLHQVFMNLCSNANQAIGAGGGRIEIDVHRHAGTSSGTQDSPDPTGRDYVVISVKDDGCGIPEDNLKRVFDPFFTTKEKGSGMGLSVVHGIVSSMEGTISIQSEVDVGTRFDVYLPLVACQEETPTAAAAAPPTGSERVLLVDDETAVAKAFDAMITGLGYQVTTFTSSVSALEEFRRRPDHYDIVVMDFSMPELSGKQLAQAILEIRPEIPVVLCTGYSQPFPAQEAAQLGIKAYLSKPISRLDLAAALRLALDDQN